MGNKVLKFPYNKTYRRQKQLKYIEAAKELKKGNRINFLKFCLLMLFFSFMVVMLLVGTAKVSELTPIIMKFLGY